MRYPAALWAMLTLSTPLQACGGLGTSDPRLEPGAASQAEQVVPTDPDPAAPPSDETDTTLRGRRLGAAGESCVQRHCAEDNVCVGYGDEPLCSERCDHTEAFCDSGALCVPLPSGEAGVCASFGRGVEGAACSTATDCAATLACVSIRGDAPTCTRACDFVEDRFPCPVDRSCAIAAGLHEFGVCEPPL